MSPNPLNAYEILGLSGEKGTIDCTVSTPKNGACQAGTLALVTGEHMPWLTELLPATTTPVDHFTGTGGEPAFKVEYTLANGLKAGELCEGNLLTKALTNDAIHKSVEGSILNALSTRCNTRDAVAHTTAEGSTTLLNSDTLTVDD